MAYLIKKRARCESTKMESPVEIESANENEEMAKLAPLTYQYTSNRDIHGAFRVLR